MQFFVVHTKSFNSSLLAGEEFLHRGEEFLHRGEEILHRGELAFGDQSQGPSEAQFLGPRSTSGGAQKPTNASGSQKPGETGRRNRRDQRSAESTRNLRFSTSL